jgi:ferrous iron transport protein B
MKNNTFGSNKSVETIHAKSETKNADSKHIMLVGNPNCGKSTLFNRLCNLRVRTGNYPGVTVSRHVGNYTQGVQIIDIPGIYSLSSATEEEKVAVAELLDNDAELIVNVIDSTSLERSLYLTLELKMLGVPMIILLNMWDEAKKDNIFIDDEKLSKILGCKVIPISATSGLGVEEFEKEIKEHQWDIEKSLYIGNDFVKDIIEEVSLSVPDLYKSKAIFYAKSAIQGDDIPKQIAREQTFVDSIKKAQDQLLSKYSTVHEAIATDRYSFIADILAKVYQKDVNRKNLTYYVDKLVLNKYLAFPIFLLIMSLVYWISVAWLGSIVTDWTNEEFFGAMVIPYVSETISNLGASEWFTSLVSDGILGGVGAVLGFVPQLIILFLLLSVLEECGYMTRAAFILDRVFRFLGLSGKAFIPYLISTGCGVPALMTVRTLSSESERRTMLFTTTMIPCGAKLPVIIVFSEAIFGEYGFFASGMYLLSVFIIILSALIMKKFATFKPSNTPLLLEFPLYHIPTLRVVLLTVYHRSKSFVIKSGTIIFASVTVIWMLSSFAWNGEEKQIQLTNEPSKSILADIAKPVSSVFAPIGMNDYRATVAIFSGLIAKENIVGSLAVFSGVESEEDEAFYQALGDNIFEINKDKAKGMWAALAFVIFNLFTIPCLAAVGVLKREIGSNKLFMWALLYQIVFSYSLSMIIYQFGMYASYGVFNIFGAVSVLLVVVLIYLLFIKKSSQVKQNIEFKLKN